MWGFFSSLLAANRSFESKKQHSSEALWVLEDDQVPEFPVVLFSTASFVLAWLLRIVSSIWIINPWIRKFNVVENMHWLKIVSIVFEGKFFQVIEFLYLYKYSCIRFGLYLTYCYRMAIKMYHLELHEFFS